MSAVIKSGLKTDPIFIQYKTEAHLRPRDPAYNTDRSQNRPKICKRRTEKRGHSPAPQTTTVYKDSLNNGPRALKSTVSINNDP